MQIKTIDHGFTYVYEKDATGCLRPAGVTHERRAWSRIMFQNYTEARTFLKERGDGRKTYYLSGVPYAN